MNTLTTTLELMFTSTSGTVWSVESVGDVPGYLVTQVRRGEAMVQFFARDYAYRVSAGDRAKVLFSGTTRPDTDTGGYFSGTIDSGIAYTGRAWEYVRDYDGMGVPCKALIADARPVTRPRITLAHTTEGR